MKLETKRYLTIDKPLIFKHKNITKISELIKKQNTNQSLTNEKKNNTENEDEEMFDAYISQRLKESQQLSTVKKKENKSKKNTKKDSKPNIIQTINDNQYQNQSGNIKSDIKEKNTLKYHSYISSVSFTHNSINTIENIHNDLLVLLPQPSLQLSTDKLFLLQWIDLSYNKLIEVNEDITKIPYLKILYLNNNEISDMNKITALGLCTNLTTLTLSKNPVCKVKGYRQFISEMCPVLEKLDNSQITEKELDIIHFGGSKFGEKRKNGNGKVIKYPTKK